MKILCRTQTCFYKGNQIDNRRIAELVESILVTTDKINPMKTHTIEIILREGGIADYGTPRKPKTSVQK